MNERAAAGPRGRPRPRPDTGRPSKLTPAQARQVRTLRVGGESISELVAGYSVALNAAGVGHWLKAEVDHWGTSAL
jgi:hypothetical protein